MSARSVCQSLCLRTRNGQDAIAAKTFQRAAPGTRESFARRAAEVWGFAPRSHFGDRLPKRETRIERRVRPEELDWRAFFLGEARPRRASDSWRRRAFCQAAAE